MKLNRFRVPPALLLGWGLSLIFLVLSYLRILGDTQSVLFDHAAFHAVFERPIIGTALAGHIAWFAVGQIALHLVLGSVCCALAYLTLTAFPVLRPRHRPAVLTALWFAMVAFWLVLWNAGNYPNTSLGKPYATVAEASFAGLPVHAWLSVCIAVVAGGVCVAAVVALIRTRSPRWLITRGGVLFAPILIGACVSAMTKNEVTEAPADKPNIIFLGIDSLRYDEVGRPGPESSTPNVDAFVADAVRFDNAITPLARTYPAWVSLLTGRHPHTTGAILNLLPASEVKLGATLPGILRDRGYHTVYAIDEVRFSNIDQSYGFDQVISPGMGSADFILGVASDTPLLNLVVNTRIGKWFFPYSHANRAIAQVYEPDTFVARVRDDVKYQAPLFLAAHMTLPHWPYKWRGSPTYPPAEGAERPQFYIDAVRRADAQFGEILRSLEERGILRNAVVVTFSDHGETFGAEADPLIPKNDPLLADIRATPTWGHGTTVLSPHQYRVFLAVRCYGPARHLLGQLPGRTRVAATIEDIAPTLLNMLGLQTQASFDGVSLLPELRTVRSDSPRLAHRVRFTETEFNPMNLVAMTGDFGAVNASSFEQAANYYRVDPLTDRLEMKPRFLDLLRRNRQFAAIGWQQMIGVFPSPASGAYTILIVALDGKAAPRRAIIEQDLRGDPELQALWSGLCSRYGSIIASGTQPMKCALEPLLADGLRVVPDPR